MTIKNPEALKIHIRPPEKMPEGFMFRDYEIRKIHRLLDKVGGNKAVIGEIRKILKDNVEGTDIMQTQYCLITEDELDKIATRCTQEQWDEDGYKIYHLVKSRRAV